MHPTKSIVAFLNAVWNDKASKTHNELYDFFSDHLIINSPIGKRMGVPNLIEINNKWCEAFPDMTVSDIKVDSVENVIISTWKSEGTHQRNFQGISPTGRKVNYTGATYFIFQDEKIVRYACTIDMVLVHKQLGFFLKQEEYSLQEILGKNKKLLVSKIKESCKGKTTTREVECLSLYLCGFNSKQIGKLLFISPRTVETHVHRALHEIQCGSKEQCIEMMIENNLLPLWQDLAKNLIRRI